MIHIVSLHIKNFGIIEVAEIEPGGGMITLGGKNAQGKSTVMNAILLTLAGKGAAKDLTKLIRDGASKAEVRIVTSNGLEVRRTWTQNGGSQLVVRDETGKRSSPQELLNKLFGSLTFDPLKFSNLGTKDQVDQLLEVAPLTIDLDEVAAKRKALYDQRAEQNRQARDLTAQAEGIDLQPVDESWVLDTSVLLGQLTAADEIEQDRSRLVRFVEANASDGAGERARIEGLEQQLAEARANLEAIDDTKAVLAEEMAALPEPIDTAPIREQIALVDGRRTIVAAAERHKELTGKAEAATGLSEAYTADMDALDDSKAAALKAAVMPIEGLSIDGDTVTFEGHPLAQASSAEQLRVSTAIAMAANPELRVILIRDGSLLDEDSMLLLAEMAEADDYQMWVERVTDGDPEAATITFVEGAIQ